MLLVVAALMAGCAPSPSVTPGPADCTAEVAEYAAMVRSAVARFEEADAIAAASERDALLATIEALSEIRGEVAALQPPECALSTKVQVTRYMDLAIHLRNEEWSGPCGVCVDETLDQVQVAKDLATNAVQALGGD